MAVYLGLRLAKYQRCYLGRRQIKFHDRFEEKRAVPQWKSPTSILFFSIILLVLCSLVQKRPLGATFFAPKSQFSHPKISLGATFGATFPHPKVRT